MNRRSLEAHLVQETWSLSLALLLKPSCRSARSILLVTWLQAPPAAKVSGVMTRHPIRRAILC